ncbi:hypothetical protein L4C54_01065 [Vibrio lamellibrachiae]|uniref:hypothetical protein n=1 Tax=Vibrio lamellibrachiae TaxID=2910253 RepID=UPI003D11C377
MIARVLMLVVLAVSWSIQGQDDADYNKTARNIKKDLVKQLRRMEFKETEFCNLMLEMKLGEKHTTIRRVQSTGSTSLCRASKKILKIKKKYSYTESQKYLHIHVASKNF